MAWSERKYEFDEVFSLDRRTVWELLADTDHLNRFIGLFELTPSAPDPESVQPVRKLEGRKYGLSVKWKEYPFEWVRFRSYEVLRVYDSGPFARFRGGIELEDVPGRMVGSTATRVRLYGIFTPSSPLGLAAAALTGKSAMLRTLDYLRAYIRHASEGKGHVLPALKTLKPNRELDRMLLELEARPVRKELIPLLKSTLTESGEDDAAELRPYEWSRRTGCSRQDAVRLFLYATQAGLLDLNWQLLCPTCRSGGSVPTLRELEPVQHCDFCGIPYELELDRYVELVFSVHPRIRKVRRRTYCVGGPGLSPHILVQANLTDGEERVLPIPISPVPVQLRVLRHNHRLRVEGDGSGRRYVLNSRSAWSVEQAADGSGTLAGAAKEDNVPKNMGRSRSAPSGSLRILNDSGRPVTVVLELADWEDRFLTAAKVTAMPEFRSLFSSEVLAPGQQVGIRSIAVLFSDLKNSTSFYAQTGDAHAYGQVRNHFDYMSGWIRRHEGALVKTIGDAVMAVFETAGQALEAALDIQLHLPAYNAHLPEKDRVSVKLGLHEGPAIVVNSNGQLDYFGQTVNMASRIQSFSRGGDILMEEKLASRLRTHRERLEGLGLSREDFTAAMKGLDRELQVVRIGPLE
ncbi:adenylate/guanylate cyclase domain-containing protein [Gorillibacterium sp. sgz5001074]|uniref:adenylate/guanylate cyclase domain-containing protein n=1 Tax=Gorillibacterium sp. sgz5001074 TaxID=3446695 RepID=UPI003F6789DE